VTIRERDGATSTPDALAEQAPPEQPEQPAVPRGSLREVLWVATRLGLTSFGGPIAHLGYFHQEYVVKRRWLDERSFADLVALCQFLPGAASSKLGMSIGILRAGPLGGLVAWLGFTLPSAALLTVAALLLGGVSDDTINLLHGLKVVAVAVIAQAVWGMARNLAPDRPRATIAVLSAAAVLLLPVHFGQVTVIAVAAIVGWRLLRSDENAAGPGLPVRVPRWLGITSWIALIGLMGALPLARAAFRSHTLALFDSVYRSGALVFGGGHVVLPLLRAEMVPPGWLTEDKFLAGYGLAQAVPGPLFTFGAYLGAAEGPAPHGILGACIALIAIFLPSILLTYGALPWWGVLRTRPAARAALRGVNAGVVGILLAALYNPVWRSAILHPADFVIALCGFALLTVWRCPPWVVVVLAGVAGALVA
jgi:chromate transporter